MNSAARDVVARAFGRTDRHVSTGCVRRIGTQAIHVGAALGGPGVVVRARRGAWAGLYTCFDVLLSLSSKS